MPKTSSPTRRDIEKLLSEQTATILRAVDGRLGTHEIALVAKMEKHFDRIDSRFSQKLDKLMTTLDRFLKRLTDFDDEFEILKREVSRIKSAIREKLGVTIE